MSAFGARFVLELRQQEFLAVEGKQLGHISAVEDFLRKGDHDFVFALAIETLVLETHGISFRVRQLDCTDELQVRTIDLDLLATLDGRACLKRIAGNAGGAKGQRQAGDGLAVLCDDLDHATVGGDAGRSGHADHVIADNFEIGDTDAIRELDRASAGEAGTIDGHRLAGDHLGREEHLDAQPGFRRLLKRFLQKVAGREAAHQGNCQEYA